MIHRVQPGETLGDIAVRYGTTVRAIMRANGIRNPNLIYAGQTLQIPMYSQAMPYPQAMQYAPAMPYPQAMQYSQAMPYPQTAMYPQTAIAEGPHTHHPHEHRFRQHQQRLDALEGRMSRMEQQLMQPEQR